MKSLRNKLLIVVLSFTIVFFSSISLEAAGPKGKAEISFSQGLLEYNDKHYSKAIEYFQKALSLDPSRSDAAFFLGLSYDSTGDKKKALEALSLSEKLATDEESRKRIRAEIERVGKEESHRRWDFYGSLSTQYDSNVTLEPDQITIATLPSQKDDAEFGLQVGGSYEVIRKQHYQLKPEISYYQSLYPQLNDFDYGLTHVALVNQFSAQKISLQLPLAYEFSVLGTEKYLQSGQFLPQVTYFGKNRFLSRLSLPVRIDDFLRSVTNPAQNQDALNIEPTLGETIYFDHQKRFLDLFYDFERNFAKGGDWDYRGHTIGVSLFNPIAWKVSSYLYATLTVDKSFDNVDSIFGVKRDDFYQQYGITFSRSITKQLSLGLNYHFTRNDSNISLFEYNRHQAGVTFGFHL